MTRRREKIRKEADKNIKGNLRNVVPANLDQNFCRKSAQEPLRVSYPKFSPPGL